MQSETQDAAVSGSYLYEPDEEMWNDECCTVVNRRMHH
jgi:hypothetical protein